MGPCHGQLDIPAIAGCRYRRIREHVGQSDKHAPSAMHSRRHDRALSREVVSRDSTAWS